MSTLKPCPFCGSDKIKADTYNYCKGLTAPFVACKSCRMGLKFTPDVSLSEAIDHWNTRELAKFTDAENNILFYAFRYCLGRMTSAVENFCNFAAANVKRIRTNELELMYDEIESARKHDDETKHDPVFGSRLGMDCDRADWLKLRDTIMDEIKTRRKK